MSSSKLIFGGAAVASLTAALWYGVNLLSNDAKTEKKKKTKAKKHVTILSPGASNAPTSSSQPPSAAASTASSVDQYYARLQTACTRLMKAHIEIENGRQPSVGLTKSDSMLLGELRANIVQDASIAPRTRMLAVLFIVLFNIKKSHDEFVKSRTHDADASDAAMLGPLRQDLTLAWNSLEPALRNITEMSSQIQYILIIVTNWLAQRLQCGTKLGFMVDSVINHVFSGNVSHLVVAQLCCACAILGRWSDVHELKVLLASADPMTLQKRFEDYNFLARTSLYNLDLRTICELAETLAPVPPATLDDSALGFTPSSDKLSWKCAKLRSMRIKGPTDPEFREIKVNARQTLTMICTGRVARMRNISNIQLVLNGAVSANEMDLSGYQVVKTVMPAGFDSNQDAQAAVAVDAVAASEDQDESTESTKVEEIEESPTAGAFKHAEKPQLRRERLHIQRDADKKIRNVWKGTYLVTHELMENQEEDIEKEMMQIINAGAEAAEGADAENGADAEAEADADAAAATEDGKPKEPNADSLLEGLMKILQKSAASQKQVVLRVESEIEMEFTPFVNLIEAPSELAGLFSADLQRMHDYLMSLPHVDVTPVAAPAAPAVTVDKAEESK